MPEQIDRVRDFEHLSVRCRLLPDYFRNSTTDPRGVFGDEEVAETLDIIAEYWRLYLDLGFQTFGVKRGGRYIYKVVFDAGRGTPGQANDEQMELRGDMLRNSKDLRRSAAEREKAFIGYKSTIIHELFHAVTWAVEDPFESDPSFREGAADVASFLLLGEDERLIMGIPSYKEYLGNPGVTMWDRSSPGLRDGSDTRSCPTLWWLYFADQLGRRTEQPGSKIDALRDMLRDEGWRDAGSLETTHTSRRVVGRFLGNGQSQILFDSDHRTRRFGLVSANASFGGSGALHAREVERQRFNVGGWRVRAGDRIVGVGDLMGNGRDQFVVQSANPMYLGVLGYSQTDGEWFRTFKNSYAIAGKGGRWERMDGNSVLVTAFTQWVGLPRPPAITWSSRVNWATRRHILV